MSREERKEEEDVLYDTSPSCVCRYVLRTRRELDEVSAERTN